MNRDHSTPGRTLVPDTIRDRLPVSREERLAPFVYGGGMLAVGAALLVAKPKVGQVPNPRHGGDGPRRGVRRVAQVGRDSLHSFAPSNVTDSIGRSLMIGGVALVLTRLLDEMSGRDEG
ncbi:MAG: hypothetical protein CML66_11860 [Rhodobacteraceae bacterium]|nr:hypothetical protein [Paracoccaceae bacterium]